MTNEVQLFQSGKLPAYLQQAGSDAMTKALAGGGMGKRISIKGGVFRMIVDGEEVATSEDRAMNVVIVAAADKVVRTFYSATYKEGEAVSPDCWASDGATPDADVPAETKQAPSCATCPQNISGSGQGDSRACRFSRRLAVVLENDMEGAVYQMSLPSQSIFGKGEDKKLPLQAFAKYMQAHNAPINGFVTEMRFDVKSATPKLFFWPVRVLEEEEYRTAVQQGQSTDAKQAILFTVAKLDGVPPKSNGVAPTSVPAPKEETPAPAPIEEKPKGFKKVTKPEVTSTTVTEPTVKTTKKDATPAPVGKNIESILSKWADDEA